MHLGKGRNVVVPFQQRCRGPYALDCASIHFPHRVEHWMIVRVESVLLEFGVAGNMYLGDTSYLDAVHIFKWIEAVVLRRDIDIVYVEQDAAVGSVDDLVEKLPLSHLRFMKF